jgi:hypothetical protein
MPTFRANLEVDETRVKSGFHEGLGAKNHWNLRFYSAFRRLAEESKPLKFWWISGGADAFGGTPKARARRSRSPIHLHGYSLSYFCADLSWAAW